MKNAGFNTILYAGLMIFSGITNALVIPGDVAAGSNEYRAYVCDVDVFGFSLSSLNLNSKTELSSAEYTAVSSQDNQCFTIDGPGLGDETLLWIDMNIGQTASSIQQLDLAVYVRPTVEPYASFRLYVLKAGYDYLDNNSWVQIGDRHDIVDDAVEGNIIRSVKSNIGDYIDSNGNITWAVYVSSPSNADLTVDYIELATRDRKFFDKQRGDLVQIPGDFDYDGYVDMYDISTLGSYWIAEDAAYYGTPIAIVNAGFEGTLHNDAEWVSDSGGIYDIADQIYYGTYMDGWSNYKPDWQSSGATGIVIDTVSEVYWDAEMFPGTDKAGYGRGIARGWNADGFAQTLTETLRANTTYTLRFDMGMPTQWSDYKWLHVALTAGGKRVFLAGADMGIGVTSGVNFEVPLDDVGMVLGNDHAWVKQTLTFTTGTDPAGLGETLRLLFYGGGGITVDNFELYQKDADSKDIGDLVDIASHWLECSDPENPDCDGYYTKRYTGTWYETLYSKEGNYIWREPFGAGSTNQMIADVNGDGKDDAVTFTNGSWVVAISDGAKFGSPANWRTGFGSGTAVQMLADVDGDGDADAVVFNGGTWYVALSTGNGFGSVSTWANNHGLGSASQMLGDVNGDGKADAVTFFSNGTWQAALSSGSGFGTVLNWTTNYGVGSASQMLGDVNGDGNKDAVTFYSGGIWQVALSGGSAFISPSIWKTDFGSETTSQFVGDVDGDGKADAVTFFANGTWTEGIWYYALSDGAYFGEPIFWKRMHGSTLKNRMPYDSVMQCLGDPFGSGLSAPIVYFDYGNIWKVLPADQYVAGEEVNLWEAYGVRYLPVVDGEAGQYASDDPDVMDAHIKLIAEAGIDYLLFELGNHLKEYYTNNAITVSERLALWNSDCRNRPLYYAVAVGGAQFNQQGSYFEYEAGEIWDRFCQNPDVPSGTYFNLEGKPLLVGFECEQYWNEEAWDGLANEYGPARGTETYHFTVRWATGAVFPRDYPYIPSWIELVEPEDYGLYFGWLVPQGTLENSEQMAIMPGANNHIDGGIQVSRTIDGIPGGFYTYKGWNAVLRNKPEVVTICSFNDYLEDTAVEPCDTSTVGTSAEPWNDENGQPAPYLFWDLTKEYNKRYKRLY